MFLEQRYVLLRGGSVSFVVDPQYWINFAYMVA